MATSPFVLPMDAFWQVLIVSVVLLFVLPLQVSHVYYWLYMSGMFVSVLSVIGFGDSTGLDTINAQVVPALAVALLFVARMVIEDKTDRHLLLHLASTAVRVISPVSGIDPENQDQPQHPPQNARNQQEQGHGQAPDGYTVIPEPERVDGAAAQDEESIEDLVEEADDINEFRQ